MYTSKNTSENHSLYITYKLYTEMKRDDLANTSREDIRRERGNSTRTKHHEV